MLLLSLLLLLSLWSGLAVVLRASAGGAAPSLLACGGVGAAAAAVRACRARLPSVAPRPAVAVWKWMQPPPSLLFVSVVRRLCVPLLVSCLEPAADQR